MSDELDVLANTNDSYFGDEYLGYSIGTGLFWVVGMITPITMMYAWLMPESYYGTINYLGLGQDKPINIAWNYVSLTVLSTEFPMVYGLTLWTRIAWYFMAIGSTAIYGTLTVFWLLAYIKDPWFQKAYFKSTGICTIASWVLSVLVAIFFIVGAVVTDNETLEPKQLVNNMVYMTVFVVAVIVVDLIVYLGMGEQVMNYYKWDQQDWWNGEEAAEDEQDISNSDPFTL